MKKNKLVAIILVFALILAFGAGCTTDKTPETSKAPEASTAPETTEELPILGVTIYSAADNFVSYITKSITATADGLFQSSIEDGQNEQTTQMNQIDTMIAKGAKALAICLVDITAAPAVIQKATEGGNIPVIFFNNSPSAADINSYENAYFVGSTTGDWGASIQAAMIVDAFKNNPKLDKNGDGIIQIVNLMGDPAHAASKDRADYVKSGITDAGLQYELLAEDTGNWVTANAKDKMDAWISKYGNEIEFIIGANDAMALGALTSIQAAGFNTEGPDGENYIPVIGIDAIPEMLSKIESGEVIGSVLQDAKTQGEIVVKIAYNLANGKDAMDGLDFVLDANKSVGIPYKAIDKTNLADAGAGY